MKAAKRIISLAICWMGLSLVTGALVSFISMSAAAADKVKPAAAKPAIEPQVDAQMRRMGDYLAQAQFFSVSAEVWQDAQLASGQRFQAGRTVDLQVRRPNRFHVEVHSTRRERGLYYDGASITMLDRTKNFYGSVHAPATIDEAVDAAIERLGVTIPLEDLIVNDPYKNALSKVTSAIDLGPVTVLGVACEHLAFSQGASDWQIWIEQGAVPVPRKIVITYKDEEGAPQYTAIFSNWDFQTKLPDFVFKFEPPAGSMKISVSQIKSENQARKSEVK